jgi:small GTP-binding protein
LPTVNGEIRLSVWDTAGQELYRSTVPLYVRGSKIGIVVFDLSEPETAAAVPDWIALFADIPPGQCQIVVVGNKSDSVPWKANIEEMIAFCANKGDLFFLTSAENGEGIQTLMQAVAGIIKKGRKGRAAQHDDGS